MKIIGLIGGMSWESTVPYYRQINESIKAQLGGLHSARLILYSVDFHEIERLQHAGNWNAAGAILAGVSGCFLLLALVFFGWRVIGVPVEAGIRLLERLLVAIV